jgi:hypothetical protein
MYLGAFANPSHVDPVPIGALASLEAQIGRKVALTQHYYGFYDDFPGPYEADDLANGRIPIESWNCQVSNAEIAAGHQDATIRKRADALKAYRKPIFLRYMWEMNIPAKPSFRQGCYDPATDAPNGVFSAPQYIAAWIHIRQIFAVVGATNVVWLWNPDGRNNPLPYYPGASQVDWVGFDLYDDADLSFADLYRQIYGWLTPLGKPILVGETGADPAIQPAFFSSAVNTLQTQYPLIRGYVYFDAPGPAKNWVLGGAGLEAFKRMAADPYFSANGPP